MRTCEPWTRADLRFLVDTLVPGGNDPEHLVDLLRDDERLLDAMLHDDRLFRQLMDDDEVFVSVSPLFFFKVLLLRARRDLKREIYTIERRNLQKVVLFDANRVVDLLSDPAILDYLATTLASFTRIHSMTISLRVRQGIWYRMRVNDLDVDSLIRYTQTIEEQQRFRIYRRIGDACLFLAGVFPEHIDVRQSYPQSSGPRLRMQSSLLQNLEDYESHGRAFYRLAARHPQAQVEGLDRVLETMSEQWILATKPLGFIAQRYLALRKRHVFPL
jgi:hypothetical protein